MAYARVAVDSGRPQREPFTYSVPKDLAVGVGQGVLVPFGRQMLQGVVLELEDSSEIAEPRPIHSLIDESPLLTAPQIELALWISDYYQAPLFDCAALFLPPGFSRKPLRMLRPSPISDASALERLSPRQSEVLTTITGRGPISSDRLDALLDGKTMPTIRALLRMHPDRREVHLGAAHHATPRRTDRRAGRLTRRCRDGDSSLAALQELATSGSRRGVDRRTPTSE